MPADPRLSDLDTFRFTRRSVDGRRVRLGYALTGRTEQPIEFEETLEIPDSLGPLRSASDPAVLRVLLATHLAGGTSYWKTCIPRSLALEGASLSPEDAAFWNEIYTKGMGEFFFRNAIDPTGHVAFPEVRGASGPARASSPTGLNERPRALLAGTEGPCYTRGERWISSTKPRRWRPTSGFSRSISGSSRRARPRSR